MTPHARRLAQSNAIEAAMYAPDVPTVAVSAETLDDLARVGHAVAVEDVFGEWRVLSVLLNGHPVRLVAAVHRCACSVAPYGKCLACDKRVGGAT